MYGDKMEFIKDIESDEFITLDEYLKKYGDEYD